MNSNKEITKAINNIYYALFKITITTEILEHSIEAINILNKNYEVHETELWIKRINKASDLISLELFLRFKHADNYITKCFLIIFGISECYVIHYDDIVNEKKSRINAFGLLLLAVLKTPFLYTKGYIINRIQCKILP